MMPPKAAGLPALAEPPLPLRAPAAPTIEPAAAPLPERDGTAARRAPSAIRASPAADREHGTPETGAKRPSNGPTARTERHSYARVRRRGRPSMLKFRHAGLTCRTERGSRRPALTETIRSLGAASSAAPPRACASREGGLPASSPSAGGTMIEADSSRGENGARPSSDAIGRLGRPCPYDFTTAA
jgi:hypothetical protein